ncbi:Uncharacterized protein dnm_053960 [Desulfonema magnum]|uniref:Uncharacterized protein n=1 Tax=Desulfonema magnum TaxID=45655 RepID=A0A975BPP3_9BACT|nr:Uncharacterized protein dnm_053960 [Desulfonema magnum]
MRGTKTGSAFSEPWKHFHHPRQNPTLRIKVHITNFYKTVAVSFLFGKGIVKSCYDRSSDIFCAV